MFAATNNSSAETVLKKASNCVPKPYPWKADMKDCYKSAVLWEIKF